jgi:hypothetical protein
LCGLDGFLLFSVGIFVSWARDLFEVTPKLVAGSLVPRAWNVCKPIRR